MTEPHEGVHRSANELLLAPYRYCRRCPKRTQQRPEAVLYDSSRNQPADAAPCRAQHRMDLLDEQRLRVTASHPVSTLQLCDQRFNRLPALDRPEFKPVEPLRLTTVFDLEPRITVVHAEIAEIAEIEPDGSRIVPRSPLQDRCMFDLLGVHMVRVRFTVEDTGVQDQAAGQSLCDT